MERSSAVFVNAMKGTRAMIATVRAKRIRRTNVGRITRRLYVRETVYASVTNVRVVRRIQIPRSIFFLVFLHTFAGVKA